MSSLKTETPKYRLIYYPLRGRGELVRLLFAHLQISYEDARIDPSDWATSKPGNNLSVKCKCMVNFVKHFMFYCHCKFIIRFPIWCATYTRIPWHWKEIVIQYSNSTLVCWAEWWDHRSEYIIICQYYKGNQCTFFFNIIAWFSLIIILILWTDRKY